MPKANELSAINGRKAGLFLFFLTIVVYLPAMHGDFVCDDEIYIKSNPLLQTADGLKLIWTNIKATPQYYPLTFTTFWAEFQVWRLWTTGYHLTNVLLHAVNATLLWTLLRRLSIPGAWFAAAIFALHPIQVESVAQISERKNVLSGLFYFLALLAYMRFSPFDDAQSSTYTHNTRRWDYYILALVCFSCALLSKTVACSLPAVILLLLWWKVGRVHLKDLLPLVPMFVLGFAFARITAIVEKDVTGAIGKDWEFSFIERTLIAGRALWFYVSKIFWPSNLTYIYPRWTIDSTSWWQYIFPLTALVVLTLLASIHKRIGRAPIVAALSFSGTLLPMLGFFNVYLMRYTFVADHFQYLSCISIVVLTVSLFWQKHVVLLNESSPHSLLYRAPYCTLLSGAILIFLGLNTWQQAHVYAGPETLWSDTLKKDPTSWIAHNNLGSVFLNKGEYQQALFHFEEAVRLKQDLPEAQSNLSRTFLKMDKLDAAVAHGLQAIKLKPDSSEFYSILGSIYWRKKDVIQAAQYFADAIHREPVSAQAHYNLGLLYIKEAEAFRDKFPQEAVAHFEKALSLAPDSMQTVAALAWTLATHPDATVRNGSRAQALAERACEQTNYKSPILLDILAAAYAEDHRFSDAIRIAQIGAELAKAQGQEAVVGQIEKRLHLYQSSQPYTDPEVWFPNRSTTK